MFGWHMTSEEFWNLWTSAILCEVHADLQETHSCLTLSTTQTISSKGYAPEEPKTQGWRGGAVNKGLPKFSNLQKMWGYKVF